MWPGCTAPARPDQNAPTKQHSPNLPPPLCNLPPFVRPGGGAAPQICTTVSQHKSASAPCKKFLRRLIFPMPFGPSDAPPLRGGGIAMGGGGYSTHRAFSPTQGSLVAPMPPPQWGPVTAPQHFSALCPSHTPVAAPLPPSQRPPQCGACWGGGGSWVETCRPPVPPSAKGPKGSASVHQQSPPHASPPSVQSVPTQAPRRRGLPPIPHCAHRPPLGRCRSAVMSRGTRGSQACAQDRNTMRNAAKWAGRSVQLPQHAGRGVRGRRGNPRNRLPFEVAAGNNLSPSPSLSLPLSLSHTLSVSLSLSLPLSPSLSLSLPLPLPLVISY